MTQVMLHEAVRAWFDEYHSEVSQFHSVLDNLTVFYVQGMRIGWVTDAEFVIGNSNHYSTMLNKLDKLNPADPKFFDIIDDRLKRIGV